MGAPRQFRELMAIVAAHEIRDGDRVFVGTGLPMIATYFAKRRHAPNAVLIFESGIIGASPRHLAPGVGDFRLMPGSVMMSGLYYALSLLQRGCIDIGFLGGAQVDRYGNLNSTVIGDYGRPKVRLPGSGGANDIASLAKRVVIIMPHEPRRLVERVDYLTSPGFLGGGAAREQAGLSGGGPVRVITDLAVFSFDPGARAIRLDAVFPGVSIEEVRSRAGFQIEPAQRVAEVPPPSVEDTTLIRELDPEGVYMGQEP